MAARLKCFVASAFGHVDVDRVFSRAVCPVLRELGIQSLRVDRVEHNDDIDDKIFELLRASDFCIADLTHARPSVYYEAGFAQGTDRQVIYIVRSDHFPRRGKQLEENLRVHFDLQMRNIIAWSGPTDAFKRKLRQRIRKVIRPLLIRRQQREAIEHEVQSFNSLSIYDRLTSLVGESSYVLKRRGFKVVVLSADGKAIHIPYSVTRDHREICARVHKTTYQQVSIVAMARMTPHAFINPGYLIASHVLADAENVKRTKVIMVAICLHSVHASTLNRLFPKATPLGDKVFLTEIEQSRTKRPTSTVYVVIDGVKRLHELNERLTAVLDKLSIDPIQKKTTTRSKSGQLAQF